MRRLYRHSMSSQYHGAMGFEPRRGDIFSAFLMMKKGIFCFLHFPVADIVNGCLCVFIGLFYRGTNCRRDLLGLKLVFQW